MCICLDQVRTGLLPNENRFSPLVVMEKCLEFIIEGIVLKLLNMENFEYPIILVNI